MHVCVGDTQRVIFETLHSADGENHGIIRDNYS